jgi:hypothetical protein
MVATAPESNATCCTFALPLTLPDTEHPLSKLEIWSFQYRVSTNDSEKIRLGLPVYRDGQHVISVCENAVLTYSSHAPNPEYLEAWTRTVELMLNDRNAALFVMTIINRHAQAPDDASKTSIRNTILQHASRITSFAYVVDGEGFRAAAMRSALSLISLTARYPFPQKVFGRVEDAVPWMLSRPYPRSAGDQQMQRGPAATKLIEQANALSSLLISVAAAG